MKATSILCSFFLSFVVLAGCNHTKPVETTEAGAPVKKTNVITEKPARVLVDGREKAVTPAVVTIRRSFNENEVLLIASGKHVRKFEIERVYSSSAGAMTFSFFGSDSDVGGYKFDVAELPKKKNGTIIIPFTTSPLQIEDREYGLTLMIEND